MNEIYNDIRKMYKCFDCTNFDQSSREFKFQYLTDSGVKTAGESSILQTNVDF